MLVMAFLGMSHLMNNVFVIFVRTTESKIKYFHSINGHNDYRASTCRGL